MSTASESVAALEKKFGDAMTGTHEFRGELTVIAKREKTRELLQFCREKLGYDYLIDICSVDNHGEDPRFEVVYELYSLGNGAHAHLRVKCAVAEEEKPDSVADLWPTAEWHEREIYDMMGIEFEGHPDLRRILMWEGYPYFPLRKDFPLAGRPSDMPDVAFTDTAPLDGGPFVTSPTDATTTHREPRSREID